MSLDVDLMVTKPVSVFSYNITHNLGSMAKALEVYQHLWRPEEIGITKAHQLIEPLEKAYLELIANFQSYEQYNPENGWGTIHTLRDFIKSYLEACKETPDADIHVNR
jgi:hypothetical protein